VTAVLVDAAEQRRDLQRALRSTLPASVESAVIVSSSLRRFS